MTSTPRLLPCRSPSTRAEAAAAYRAWAKAHPHEITSSYAHKILSLWGAACEALRVGPDDDVVPVLPDLCRLRAGNRAGFARAVPADAPSAVEKLARRVYGYRGSVRAQVAEGGCFLAASWQPLLAYARPEDQQPRGHLLTLARICRHLDPDAKAPAMMPSSAAICTAAAQLPKPVAPGSVRHALATYRKLQRRAVQADPANAQHFAPLADPRRVRGRGLLAVLATSGDPGHRALADAGDLRAAVAQVAPVAFRQLSAYEQTPVGCRGRKHERTTIEDTWRAAGGLLAAMLQHAPERVATFQVRHLWETFVDLPPAAVYDEWNPAPADVTSVQVRLARWVVDRLAGASRRLSTHGPGEMGYTQSLLGDVTAWWTLTERFHADHMRAHDEPRWAEWQRAYRNLREFMRAKPVPPDERIEKATVRRMEAISLPHIWCVGLPIKGRDAARLLDRVEDLVKAAEEAGHREPRRVPAVRTAVRAFVLAAEEYLMTALPWIDMMRLAQYRCGTWGGHFVPDLDEQGQLVALHTNWLGKRLAAGRVKQGKAGRRAFGPGRLDFRVLAGYLEWGRAPRLERLGLTPEEARTPDGRWPLFVSSHAKSLADSAWSESTIRVDRVGRTLHWMATEILGRDDLPAYDRLDRAGEWKAAWALHENRKDAATIGGRLMGEWAWAEEMSMDERDTLTESYVEPSFAAVGELGTWRNVGTYYPWLRRMMNDPRCSPNPLDDPTLPLPPRARALLDAWAAQDAAVAQRARRATSGVADARVRPPRPDVAERNRRRAVQARRAPELVEPGDTPGLAQVR